MDVDRKEVGRRSAKMKDVLKSHVGAYCFTREDNRNVFDHPLNSTKTLEIEQKYVWSALLSESHSFQSSSAK